MQRSIYILILMLVGMFIPQNISACAMKSHSADKVEESAKVSHQKDCEKACAEKQSKDHSDCGKDCNSLLCKCSVSSGFSLFLTHSLSLKHPFKTHSELVFSSYETTVSKGFYSIWLIPKIG